MYVLKYKKKLVREAAKRPTATLKKLKKSFSQVLAVRDVQASSVIMKSNDDEVNGTICPLVCDIDLISV